MGSREFGVGLALTGALLAGCGGGEAPRPTAAVTALGSENPQATETASGNNCHFVEGNQVRFHTDALHVFRGWVLAHGRWLRRPEVRLNGQKRVDQVRPVENVNVESGGVTMGEWQPAHGDRFYVTSPDAFNVAGRSLDGCDDTSVARVIPWLQAVTLEGDTVLQYKGGTKDVATFQPEDVGKTIDGGGTTSGDAGACGYELPQKPDGPLQEATGQVAA